MGVEAQCINVNKENAIRLNTRCYKVVMNVLQNGYNNISKMFRNCSHFVNDDKLSYSLSRWYVSIIICKLYRRPYIPMLLPSIFSICMGLSLLLSTPLLGVGDGHRGDGGSLSITTILSKDFARLLGSIFRTLADDVVAPLDSNRAISCSIDRGSTARAENVVYT